MGYEVTLNATAESSESICCGSNVIPVPTDNLDMYVTCS